MSTKNYHYTEEEVKNWANIYLSNEQPFLKTMEIEIGIPHSTIWWNFVHRLPNIDISLYLEVLKQFRKNKGRRRENKKVSKF